MLLTDDEAAAKVILEKKHHVNVNVNYRAKDANGLESLHPLTVALSVGLPKTVDALLSNRRLRIDYVEPVTGNSFLHTFIQLSRWVIAMML